MNNEMWCPPLFFIMTAQAIAYCILWYRAKARAEMWRERCAKKEEEIVRFIKGGK